MSMLPDVVIAVSSALRQSRPPTPPVAPAVRRAPKAPTATSPVPSGRVLGRAMLHSLGSSSRSVRSPSGNDPWRCITIRSLITAWTVPDRLQQRHGLLAAVWGVTGKYDRWSNLSGSGLKTDSNNSIIRPRRPAVVCCCGRDFVDCAGKRSMTLWASVLSYSVRSPLLSWLRSSAGSAPPHI